MSFIFVRNDSEEADRIQDVIEVFCLQHKLHYVVMSWDLPAEKMELILPDDKELPLQGPDQILIYLQKKRTAVA